ncbi:hypothetical protein [Cognaticolwellia mytili]|uniref:hypothetical protein n=1 Tax=Cognaticolwellia mytili TaxID=1888913 RepID=UPI000A16F66C|nr:hypothetical protein [Cognaticolwellia mytili]
MTLKANLSHFLDEEGNSLDLTEQAKKVFNFITKIILSVSHNIEHPLSDFDLKCNARATGLYCEGEISAAVISNEVIEWHCSTCEASGTISHWRGSSWDKQKRTIH